MPEKRTALKRRIAPSYPLTLELTDESGAKFTQTFQLAFNYKSGAAIQERTISKADPRGFSFTSFAIWTVAGEPHVLAAIFWGAVAGAARIRQRRRVRGDRVAHR